MATNQEYLSLLVALDIALLLILAGLAKKQLDWKRPVVQPAARWQPGRSQRRTSGRQQRRRRGLLVTALSIGSGAAGAAALAGFISPIAGLAYVASAAIVLLAAR